MQLQDQRDSKSNSLVSYLFKTIKFLLPFFNFYLMYSIRIKYQLIFCVMVDCIANISILWREISRFYILIFLDVTIKYSSIHSVYLKTNGLVRITSYLNWNWFKTICIFRHVRSITSKVITLCIIQFSRMKIQFLKMYNIFAIWRILSTSFFYIYLTEKFVHR